ncbi:hypothetical protein [Rhabdaerophilum sp. SD176]|uniref:hypothetical protein n=1 Tax=Rhabdaerophilum sp. SD176 TaxID=2983548 RepID=UPI0022BC4D2F|nr:hypothetical protein [Rhabdaerophilum sp. SD176]MCZ8375067.1 hypothetical protein [Beijerinckiaceae bacterium]
MSQIFDRPKEIIDYCLKPLNLPKEDATYQEVYRRLEHVIKTYQVQMMKAKAPVAVDFSQMRTITINEDAHGHD